MTLRHHRQAETEMKDVPLVADAQIARWGGVHTFHRWRMHCVYAQGERPLITRHADEEKTMQLVLKTPCRLEWGMFVFL